MIDGHGLSAERRWEDCAGRADPYTADVRGGAIILALAFAACSTPGASAGTPTAGATVTPAAAVPSPDLTAFVGDWGRHGADLVIAPDGNFTFEWRTYRNCGQAPQPCDQTVDNVIHSGGRAVGTVHALAAQSAEGQVTATNDPTFVPAGHFLADVTTYQLLTLRFPSTTLTLCGSSFAKVAPPQVVQSNLCGA